MLLIIEMGSRDVEYFGGCVVDFNDLGRYGFLCIPEGIPFLAYLLFVYICGLETGVNIKVHENVKECVFSCYVPK